MKTIRKCSRGQVWFLVDPYLPREYDGSVVGKNRPWLIVSNDSCNQTSPVLTAVPLTTQPKSELPVHVTFNDGKQPQTILCEQIRTISEQLLYNNGSYYKYTLSPDIMQEVDNALAIQLNITLSFPNAERFWKSLESLIRTKVLRAVDETKVSPLDISKLSCLIDKNVEELVSSAVTPVMTPEPERVLEPGFVLIPASIPTPTPPIATEKKKREYRKWSDDEKKEFIDKYYKHGCDATAKEYGMSREAAMRNYCRFNKEVKDGKIS